MKTTTARPKTRQLVALTILVSMLMTACQPCNGYRTATDRTNCTQQTSAFGAWLDNIGNNANYYNSNVK